MVWLKIQHKSNLLYIYRCCYKFCEESQDRVHSWVRSVRQDSNVSQYRCTGTSQDLASVSDPLTTSLQCAVPKLLLACDTENISLWIVYIHSNGKQLQHYISTSISATWRYQIRRGLHYALVLVNWFPNYLYFCWSYPDDPNR